MESDLRPSHAVPSFARASMILWVQKLHQPLAGGGPGLGGGAAHTNGAAGGTSAAAGSAGAVRDHGEDMRSRKRPREDQQEQQKVEYRAPLFSLLFYSSALAW